MPKIARTSAANQWQDDEFYDYCDRELNEAMAAHTKENFDTLFNAILQYTTPAGNA